MSGLKLVAALCLVLVCGCVSTARPTRESDDPPQLSKQDANALADSVAGLESILTDYAPDTVHFKNPEDGQRWLTAMDERLKDRIKGTEERQQILRAVQYEATRAGLDPQLVLALIDVLSGFNKYQISRQGARGYMQVLPYWVKLIGKPKHNLFHLRTNLAYGCAIFRYYLDEASGDYYLALGADAADAMAGRAQPRGWP